MFNYLVEAMCGSREGFWGGSEGPDSQTPPLKNSNSLNLHTLNTENMPATPPLNPPPQKKTLTNLDPRIGAINYCVYEEYKVCPKIKTLRSARHRKKLG